VYGSSNTNVLANYSAGSAISGYYSKRGESREIKMSVGWGLPMDNLLMSLKQVCQ